MIKGLSLWQPWASLIALGHKRIETRSWSTTYRGWIAIHAAKKWSKDLQALCYRDPFLECLADLDLSRDKNLPLGGFVAVARLVAVDRTEVITFPKTREGFRERSFGDYRTGRFAWRLEEITAIEFLPAAGKQGLWTVEGNALDQLRERYRVARAA
jgi:activating signal cointegrator 1